MGFRVCVCTRRHGDYLRLLLKNYGSKLLVKSHEKTAQKNAQKPEKLIDATFVSKLAAFESGHQKTVFLGFNSPT
jgi:hypothetical protein